MFNCTRNGDLSLIIDLQTYDGAATHETDLCIVGAGAAGIAIAREFIGSAWRVLLLESGGLHPEADSQNLYESKVIGLPHNGIHLGRARTFGGTTTLWGGQALRFDDFDFKARPWVPYSGWPVTRKDLDPYYDRAENLLQLGEERTYESLCTDWGIDSPRFDESFLYIQCSRWSPHPNFAKAYGNDLRHATNVTVLLHANVTSIETNADATRVDRIHFRTLGGKQGDGKAKQFILCAGAIETARLLLASRSSSHASGLGNRNGLVGRFFQEHLYWNFGQVITENRSRLQDLFESFFKNRLKYAPKLTLAHHRQEEEALLAVHGEINFEQPAESSLFALKALFKAMVGRNHDETPKTVLLKRAASDPLIIVRAAYRYLVEGRSGSSSKGQVYFGVQSEQAPNPESRIVLSRDRDALGMPLVELDWRIHELDRKTAARFFEIVSKEFERVELGKLVLKNPGEAWETRLHDSAHHMGTTRMSDDPQRGVVDRHCRVHSMDNLYIGSSAVFPTSARSNPTLTLLALCLRVADHIKMTL